MDAGSILIIMLPAFCECLVLVGIHSYLGIHVIKRKVVFVDLAFAQIAALGTLVAFLFGIPPHTPASFMFAIFLCAIGAAVFSLCRFRRGRIPQEAIIGLVYAIAAATAILLIDKAPHGAEHLKEILTGSILWVKWESVLTAAVVYAAVGLFHYVFRKPFLLISEDPDAAWDAGLKVRLWDFLFYFSFGVVITLSVDVAGVLIVFVFLVAPAILAMAITDRLGAQLLIGWALGVVVTTLGLFLAYVKDLSTGPAVIATYGVAMVLVATALYVVRAPRRGVAARHVGAAALAFAAALAGLYGAGTWLGRGFADEHAPRPGAACPADEDLWERTDAIVRALEEGGPEGAALAIAFLEGDPPRFYAEQVIEKLTRVMGKSAGFVADERMDSPANRRALEEVRAFFRDR
jgi:zinc/manganese transport system permease protein